MSAIESFQSISYYPQDYTEYGQIFSAGYTRRICNTIDSFFAKAEEEQRLEGSAKCLGQKRYVIGPIIHPLVLGGLPSFIVIAEWLEYEMPWWLEGTESETIWIVFFLLNMSRLIWLLTRSWIIFIAPLFSVPIGKANPNFPEYLVRYIPQQSFHISSRHEYVVGPTALAVARKAGITIQL